MSEIDDFLNELIELENHSQKPIDKSKFPFEVKAVGNSASLVDATVNVQSLPLQMGPFGNLDITKELESKFLKPKNHIFAQRNVTKKLDLHKLFHYPEQSNLEMLFEFKRDLKTGAFDLGDFRKVTKVGASATAKNSVSFSRESEKSNNFIRGKSTNLPFIPGGMNITEKVKSLDVAGILNVHPGFERFI
jgi:hypothetical protein